MRSQYPAAQSRPQRPDWRVSLTTQERPRRPSSPGSRAEPSRAGRPEAPARSLLATRGTPGRGLQGPPGVGMSPPGEGCSDSCPLRGASASWECNLFLPTLRPGFSGPRHGEGCLACHDCPYTQPHKRALGPGGFPCPSGLIHKPALYSPRPDPRDERTSRGHASPALSESRPLCPQPLWVNREAWKIRAPRPQARSAAGGAGRPAPAAERCGPAPPLGAGEGAVGSPLSRSAPPPGPLAPGLRPGAVTTPFWLVISSPPRLACPGRTAHLRAGAQPSGLSFLLKLPGPAIRCLEPQS